MTHMATPSAPQATTSSNPELLGFTGSDGCTLPSETVNLVRNGDFEQASCKKKQIDSLTVHELLFCYHEKTRVFPGMFREESSMSLIALAWKYYPHYPLMILYNRDEFRERKAEIVHRWDTEPVLYAGRDIKSGSTWLGITATGKFAALTDFHRHIEQDTKPSESRGKLLVEYLQSDQDPESFLESTTSRRKKTLPFNLLVGDQERLFYCCSVSNVEQELSPGTHCLSDYFMDTPMPKCKYMQKQLQKRMIDDLLTDQEREELFTLLARPMRFQDDLPQRGYSSEVERELSPIFLDLGNYGTVSSSVITVDHTGLVVFSERSYQPDQPHNTHTLSFQLQNKVF